MAESPSVHKDRVLACSVYCNGSKLKDEYALVSAMVHQELNQVLNQTVMENIMFLPSRMISPSSNE